MHYPDYLKFKEQNIVEFVRAAIRDYISWVDVFGDDSPTEAQCQRKIKKLTGCKSLAEWHTYTEIAFTKQKETSHEAA